MQTLKPFEYLEPKTVNEAIGLLSSYGEKGKLLAGGVDLIPGMRLRKIRPEYVVNIQYIPGLDYIDGNGKVGLRLGALTKILSIELSQTIQKDYSIL